MWPSVISNFIWVLLIAGFVLLYKNEIGSAIESFSKMTTKIKAVTFKGVNFEIEANKEILAAALRSEEEPYAKFSKAFQNTIITEDEKYILNQLIDAKCTYENAVQILIYQLAHIRFNLKCMVTEKFLTPTQIKALEFLNSQTQPVTEDSLLNMRPDDMSLQEGEKLLGFLHHAQLVFKDNTNYSISVFGKEFLVFLVRYK